MLEKYLSRITVFSFVILIVFPLQSQIFTEVTTEAGIEHIFSHSGFIGGGVAFLDTDNDGDDDIYITSGRELDHFYINNGDGTFTNDALNAGLFLTSEYYTTGVAFGDVNRDGFQDIFVCTRGDVYNPFGKNFLFLNQQNNTFIDIWSQFEEEDFSYSVSATLFDYNHDGFLDVFVANYVEQPAFIFDDDNNIVGYDHTCFKNVLYQNIDGIQFQRIGEDQIAGSGCSLALCATDIDNDDDQDLFVINDFGEFLSPNALYENNGDLGFISAGSNFQVNQAIYGMGICQGDYNLDGQTDYYISNLGTNLLLKNNDGLFENESINLGVDDTWFNEDEGWYSVSWGCVFADFDNNSYQDLYVANGWITTPDFIPSRLNQNDVFFSNSSSGFNKETEIGIENTDVSRGVAYSDYDQDGDLDILVVNQNVPMVAGGWRTKLFRNDTESSGNYLQIDLIGYESNRNGFGSKVFLVAKNQSFVQELVGASSHCSQNSSVLHFGLDTISIVDTIIVDWLGDIENDTLYNISANQRIKIYEDSLGTIMDTMIIDTTSTSAISSNNSSSLSIYPNPTSDCLGVIIVPKMINVKFQIFNLTGEKVESGLIYDECIDVSKLRSGMYLIKVAELNLTKKFFISK